MTPTTIFLKSYTCQNIPVQIFLCYNNNNNNSSNPNLSTEEQNKNGIIEINIMTPTHSLNQTLELVLDVIISTSFQNLKIKHLSSDRYLYHTSILTYKHQSTSTQKQS